MSNQNSKLIAGLVQARAAMMNLRPLDNSPVDRQFGKIIGEVTKVLEDHPEAMDMWPAPRSIEDAEATIMRCRSWISLNQSNRVASICVLVTAAMIGKGCYYGGGRTAGRTAVDAYDINCGGCEDWAEAVVARCKSEGIPAEVADPSRIDSSVHDILDFCHVFVIANDKFYDAECPFGVAHWQSLPLIKKALAETKKEKL